jgi:hypothetical protein
MEREKGRLARISAPDAALRCVNFLADDISAISTAVKADVVHRSGTIERRKIFMI